MLLVATGQKSSHRFIVVLGYIPFDYVQDRRLCVCVCVWGYSHGVGPPSAVALLANDRRAEVLWVGEGESVEGLRRTQ